jgi:putative aminopeptidase FrvX
MDFLGESWELRRRFMSTAMMDHPAVSLFNELLVPAPSGREEQLAEIIREKLSALGYAHETDGAGNVIVRLEGRVPEAPLCCLAAHMDEIGIVVTKIEPDGRLRVDRSGGLRPWKYGEGAIEILGDHETITGVLSMGSTHTATTEQLITWKDVHVLTGLSPVQLQAAGIRPGSTGVPVREARGPVLFGDAADPLVGAWTFDDRMGVVALLRLLEKMKSEEIMPNCPMIVAFTVHEEGGGQGAKVVTQRERPEVFIAVDGSPIPPGTPLELDGRPGVWSKDRLAHYDQGLLRDLCQAAIRAGTELQPVVYESAASDASLVYYAGNAPRVACVGHVRENSHGYEVCRLSVFDNVLATLAEFVTTWTTGNR